MEPVQYFSLLVLLICVIHMIAGIGARIQSLLPSSVKRSAQDVHGALAAAQRSDWYVFFHCSDLVGKESKNPVPAGPDRNKVQHNTQQAPRRPQSRLTLS